jgi:hypothetical protein
VSSDSLTSCRRPAGLRAGRRHRARRNGEGAKIAAATAPDELRLEIAQVEGNGSTEEDVQVPERDASGMGRVRRIEHFEGRGEGARVGDARQIGIEIKLIF